MDFFDPNIIVLVLVYCRFFYWSQSRLIYLIHTKYTFDNFQEMSFFIMGIVLSKEDDQV